MVLQSSGTIKISDVKTEFQLANPVKFSSMYSLAAGFPSTGTLKLSNAYGSSAITFTNGLNYMYYANQSSLNYTTQDISYFTSNVMPNSVGTTTTLASISNVGSPNTSQSFGIQITGYFRPSSTGTWTFNLSADDAAYLWLGSSAASPGTSNTESNAQLYVNWGQGQKSYSTTLNAGVYYPLLIYYGQGGGAYGLSMSFSGPGVSTTTDGTQYFFKAVTPVQTVLSFANGLYYMYYANQNAFNYYSPTNISYFTSNLAPTSSGTTSTLASLASFGNINVSQPFGVQVVGYFVPSSTGTWTFNLSADDLAYLWLGSTAASPGTSNTTSNSQICTVTQSSYSVTLIAGVYYPMLVYYGQGAGNSYISMTFSGPGVSTTSDGSLYFFNTNTALQPVLNFDASVFASSGSGTTISSWSNAGAMGTTYNAVGYNSPTVGTASGYTHVSFNRAASQYFSIPTSLPMTWFNNSGVYSGLTIFVVAQYVGTPGSYERFIDFGNGAGSDNLIVARNGTTNTWSGSIFDGGNTVGTCASPVASDGMFHIFMVNFTNAASGMSTTLFIDDASTVAATPTTSGTPITNRTTINNYIGKSNWPDAYLNANIRQIQMYNSSLTTNQMIGVCSALKIKWGM